MPIDSVKIFPAIGVARLGNSPTVFFVGPEIPGDFSAPDGGYRDDRCRIKRQAARFRIFGYEGARLVKELTLDEPEVSSITWTVHIANKKASWRRFDGLNPSASYRNNTVTDRSSLEIDPGPRTLNGAIQAAGFNTGNFLGKSVPLGEMRTDAQGRLLVLAGFGSSGSVPPGLEITNYANNDGWHDDTADGPVTASIVVEGRSFTAAPAWVLCAPPNFAPSVESITTLYDVLLQVAIDKGLPGTNVPASPSLTNDIYPVLRRTFDIIRVHQEAGLGHSDFDDPTRWDELITAEASRRQNIFNRVRDPNNPGAGGAANMPYLFDDTYNQQHTITKTQYELLRRWKDGAFTNDWAGSPPPPSSITPEGLTRAALETCVGAALYPGIEAGWFLRDTYEYIEPFRLDHAGLSAGDVSKQMAVPWQADFYKCRKETRGPITIGWWPAQRPDDVVPDGSSSQVPWTREIVDDHQDMVDQWHKLGIVVEKSGALVETERSKVCRSLFMITDRSHFSEDEVDAVLMDERPAPFPNALYVVAEGVTVAEMGFSNYSPGPAEIAANAPLPAIRRADSSVVSGMTAVAHRVLFEDTGIALDKRQRVTFVYRIEFQDTSAFMTEVENVVASATKATLTASGNLTLLKQANPYMVDGQTHWLSTDVRVFQIKEGESRFGFTMGNNADGALSFITNVINSFRALDPVGHPYGTISEDPVASRLELSERVRSRRVFNFAVARVRFRGLALDASDVRVFFRLFTTAATGLDYNENSTYRRTPNATPISLLGLQGGHVVTVPCYGSPRVDTAMNSLNTQTDELNVQTLENAGGTEVHGYFGCWLDFNQTAPQFPYQPSPENGPWSSGRRSIQQMIRGLHQCLVAEVYFENDPISPNATPASNDNLAQRNLAIAESDNPGSAATHTVQHTFEIKASSHDPRLAATVAQFMPPPPDDVGIEFVDVRPPIPILGPDELMIRWNNLPRETIATIYMPDVDVDDILAYAGQNYEAVRIEKVDAHTIRCLFGDVSFVPLPANRRRNIAALLTLELPKGVKQGELFEPVVHQISGHTRKILGAFQFSIPVVNRNELLDRENRALSVLRHIELTIPDDDPWHAVFGRYLGNAANRVRGLGGDPDEIAPSPDGSGAVEPKRCRRLGWLYSTLLTIALALAAWQPLGAWAPAMIAGLASLVSASLWVRWCNPDRCKLLIASLIGFASGGALVSLLLLAGLAAPHGATLLAVTALVGGTLAVAGSLLRCFGPPKVLP